MTRLRRCILAGVVGLALAAPAAHAARPWHEVFAAERDTAVFLTTGGALVRAPFHLASAETLWTPAGDERVVRMLAGPRGGGLAWITRAYERDTTRLWVLDANGTRVRVRFFALLASRYGYERSEPGVPWVDDAGERGGRLVQAGTFMRRQSSNTLAWTPDGATIVFGYDGGVAAQPLAGGSGFGAGQLGPMALESLAPSPLFLVDAVDFRKPGDRSIPAVDQLDLERAAEIPTRKRAPGRATYLLVPTAGRWRAFEAAGLEPGVPHAASRRTVWWADERTVRAVRVDDPQPSREAVADAPVVWLGHDPAHRSFAWAAGTRVHRKPEDGGDSTLVVEAAAPIRAALVTRDGDTVAFAAGDSLIVWRPADDRIERFDLAGADPCAIYEAAGTMLVGVACDGRRAPRLLRVDRGTGRLVSTAAPAVKKGTFHALAGGRWILLYDPAPRPPRTLQAYDVRNDAWMEVANPGISAWEPLHRGN